MLNFSFHLIYFHKPSVPQIPLTKPKQNTQELCLHATGQFLSSPWGLSICKIANETELGQQLSYPPKDFSHRSLIAFYGQQVALSMANRWLFLARHSCMPWGGAEHTDVAYLVHLQQFSNWFTPLQSTSLKQTLQWLRGGPYWVPKEGSPSGFSGLKSVFEFHCAEFWFSQVACGVFLWKSKLSTLREV